MLLRSVYYILPVTWTHRGNLARLGTLTSFCVAGYNDLVCVDGYNDLVLRGWLPCLGLAWMVTMTWFCVVVVTSNWVCVAGDPDWFCVAGYNDLVLCGLLPWLRFAWMVTMTWFCVAKILPFQFLASRGIIQDEFVGQSFSGTGCRAATSAGCILRCLQTKSCSGSDPNRSFHVSKTVIIIKIFQLLKKILSLICLPCIIPNQFLRFKHHSP